MGPPAWCVPAILAVAIAATYSNGLDVPFVFDDRHTIADNPAIRTPSRLLSYFVDPDTTTVLPENKDLRPLVMVTLALNYQLSGLVPWSYHVVNLLVHWIAVVLAYRIVRDHLWLGAEAVPVAAAAALLMALHPLNTEPVNYVSARSALLSTVFYLAAFDAACRDRHARCVALAVCAMLTKSLAVSLPVMVLAYRLMDRRAASGGFRPLPWGLLAALGAVAVGGLLYRWLLLPPWAIDAARQPGVTPLIYFQTQWSAHLYYLRLFLWPDALVLDRVDYPWVRSLWEPQAWGSLLGLAGLGLGVWRLARGRLAVGFCALWVVIALAPESSVFPLAEAVNEHRPYVAMLGLAGLAALALWFLAALVAQALAVAPLRAFTAVVLLVGVVLAGVTHARTEVWRDEFRLWSDVIAKAPRNPRGWINAGREALVRGDLPLARTLLVEANRLSPCYSYVHLNLSALAEVEGQPAEGLRWADEAVRCNPGLALAHARRAAMLQRLLRRDEALAAYREATRLDGMLVDAWLLQGEILETRGDWTEALHAYDRAVAADPTSTEAAARADRARRRVPSGGAPAP